MRALNRLLLVVICALSVPAAAAAQASIAGTVHDSSGAVLPGVTVEASSPALIEKTRSVVTDGTGQYRIVDLRPGTYTISFSLQGFSTVKREGIELAGSFTATVNADMKVGTVTETVTVTGESPIVDVQNAIQQRVMPKDVVDSIPVGRSHESIAVLIPGLSTSTGINAQTQDVGGTNSLRLANAFTIHGGRTSDANIQQDGFQVRNIGSFANLTNMFPDMGATQEMTIDYAAGLGEAATGGVKVNYVPKEGGNTLKVSFFGTRVTPAFQGNNYSSDLKARGLTQPNSLKEAYDFNGSVGGPVFKDRLWFYVSARKQLNDTYFAGVYNNLNAGDPTKWSYLPADGQNGRPLEQADTFIRQPDVNVRVTWQATPKNKFSFYHTHQPRDVYGDRTPVSPESANEFVLDTGRLTTLSWTSPMTSRLLLDVRLASHGEELHNAAWPEDPNSVYRSLVAVTEQGGLIPGLLYRGAGQAAGPTFIFAAMSAPNIWELRASATYVTGAHAFKWGFGDSWGRQDLLERDINSSTSYRFNNGVPNLITERASPVSRDRRPACRVRHVRAGQMDAASADAQRRAAVRLVQHVLPGHADRPRPAGAHAELHDPSSTEWDDWKDISPRVAAVYDVFGNGKTAVKANVGRYVLAGDPTAGNVFSILANTVTRSWTDANGNYAPDCDLLSPNAQDNRATGGDFCGAISDMRFGTQIPSTNYDPSVLGGWGRRGYNWEVSAGVQHELTNRIGVDVGYFRRIYGNFTITKNRAVTASDFSSYSIPAPTDSRLPGGGGNTVSGVYDLNPDKVGAVDNLVTFADNYGAALEHWNGVDFTVNARPRGGILLQGGLSTGRTSMDYCAIRAVVPELAIGTPFAVNTTNPYCHVDSNFLTQIKLLGTYTVPKVDVQFSGTLQSLPGPQISANYVATNAIISPSLGRNLSGGAQNATINVVAPGTLYGERLNQLDLRFAKIFKLDRTRTVVNFDLYNALNANPVTSQNNNFAAWQVPLSILDARLFKISVQFDF